MSDERRSSSDAGLSVGDAREQYLRYVQKGEKSGNYRRNAKRILETWHGQLAAEGISHVSEIDEQAVAPWADYLKSRVDARRSDDDGDAGISATTAQTYHRYVSAFLQWCIERGHLQARGNPAQAEIVKGTLPEPIDENKQLQQFWDDERRVKLLRHAEKRAHDAVDEEGFEAVDAVRDRALVALLSFTGVRVSEILAAHHDDRRNGLRWGDILLDADTPMFWVLGKSQEVEEVPLNERSASALERLKRVQQPPTDDWPVFPTGDATQLYACAREKLPASAHDEPTTDEFVSLHTKHGVREALRDAEIAPPSLTTNGGRTRLQKLCAEADITPPDDNHAYLTPHGGRRGAGKPLYLDNPVKAQELLRHRSIDTTQQAYFHMESASLASDIDTLLDPSNRANDDSESKSK